MLSVCKYCGRIHDKNYDCGKKPQKQFKRRYSNHDKFRNTSDWQEKREEVKQRDHYLCQYCLSKRTLTSDNLSVHHIHKLEQHYDMRLDDDNLITLCNACHRLADDGKISADVLENLIKHPSGV